MARGRMLQNRISKSRRLAGLSSDTVRLLYTWILPHLDVNGNFYADPIMVKNLVFTRLNHTVDKITLSLDELECAGLIVRYEVDGDTYLNYPDFHEKQPKLNTARESYTEIPIMTPESIRNDSAMTPSQVKLSKDKLSKDKLLKEKLERFDVFWKAYPKKKNKREALSRWRNKKLPPLEELLLVLEKHKQTDDWKKENGKYIPYPSSWLNQERWTDEIETQQQEPKMEFVG